MKATPMMTGAAVTVTLTALTLLVAVVAAFQQEDEFLDGQLTLVVEDALDGGPAPTFSTRSTIQVRSVKSGSAVISHTRPWTPALHAQLRALAESDDLYRVRVYQKGSEDRRHISTFTRACQIYESSLTETLSLVVDGGGTAVVGIGIFPPVAVCSGETPPAPLPTQHNTTVIIRSPIPAPVPDTATYIEKLEAMKNEKAEGKDNRSFLAKYWIYIVPVVLIMVLFGGGQEGGR